MDKYFQPKERQWYLELAEALYQNREQLKGFVESYKTMFDSLQKNVIRINEEELITLLSIDGQSSQEQEIRSYLNFVLRKIGVSTRIDPYGNLLGTMTCGDGSSHLTILLSAHMDTKVSFNGRQILRSGSVLSCHPDDPKKSILGADDRSGIAIILEALRRIKHTGFNGKVKLAFSVQEEEGAIGASHISTDWLEGIDLAIVVDRCGNRDIVTHNKSIQFCTAKVGEFFEQMGAEIGMPDWAAVRGGKSDTAIFAQRGVPGVNLSAGYQFEHTSDEILDIDSCNQTLALILQAFRRINDFSDQIFD